ncbi:MAG: 16S rRNA (guanine(966)-N(2))-methyltransferase RsmD [Bacteroidales bacterium]
MRIISGTYKGRLIKPPPGLSLRPTTDIAREGLFNILNNILDFRDLHVLDLFAGTGSISYEFISRGAGTVHAVEAKQRHAAFIRETAIKMDMDLLTVFRDDARKFLGRTTDSYDLVFADPPYDLSWLDEIPSMITDSGCLQPGSIMIIEHPDTYNFSKREYFTQQRNYGSVNFSFFRL